MLRVAIAEDEAHARAAIRILLEQRSGVEIVAECRNGLEALDVLRSIAIDLLLLDVQMPGLDGFAVLHALGAERMPPTIFITAFDVYALKAFEVEAIDYVLKPFDEARFLAAFDRARQRIRERRTATWAERLLAATPERAVAAAIPPLSRLPVSIGDRTIFVDLDDIDWIQAADQYVVIHVGAREYLVRESLQRLAATLPQRFAQIHRSHLVNLSKVREVKRLGKGDAQITLRDGRTLRWSRRYRVAGVG